jgi:hypothetical protein
MNTSASIPAVHRFKLLFAAVFAAFALSGPRVCRAQMSASAAKDQVPDSQSLAERIQVNSQRLEATQQLDNRLRQMLASVPQPSPEALTSARAKNQQLALALAAAEKALKDFQKDNPTNSTSVPDLEKELSDAEQERDRLVKKQADELSSRNPTNGSKGLLREVVLQDLKPIPIMLVKNRVVPIMDPFFSARAARLKLALTGQIVDGVVISRVHDGEPIGNAVRPGGLLDSFLKKSDAAKSYFKFIVCADSIAAFQKAVEAVSARGFAYAWDTGKDEDITQVANQPQVQHDDRGYVPPKHP